LQHLLWHLLFILKKIFFRTMSSLWQSLIKIFIRHRKLLQIESLMIVFGSGMSTREVKKFFSRKRSSTSRSGNKVVQETKYCVFFQKFSCKAHVTVFFMGNGTCMAFPDIIVPWGSYHPQNYKLCPLVTTVFCSMGI